MQFQLYSCAFFFLGACPSQTQQQSLTPQEGEDLNLHGKRKRQNKKNPYHYLTSLLHRRQSEEDQTGILASADSEGPNYGTLRWPVCPPSHWTRLNWPPPQKRSLTSAFAAPLITELPRFSSPLKFIGVLGSREIHRGWTRAGNGDLTEDKNNGFFFSKLLVSKEFHLKMLWKYIMYINSKTREIQLPPTVITECWLSMSQHIADFFTHWSLRVSYL